MEYNKKETNNRNLTPFLIPLIVVCVASLIFVAIASTILKKDEDKGSDKFVLEETDTKEETEPETEPVYRSAEVEMKATLVGATRMADTQVLRRWSRYCSRENRPQPLRRMPPRRLQRQDRERSLKRQSRQRQRVRTMGMKPIFIPQTHRQ